MNLPLKPKRPGQDIADRTEAERLLRIQSLVMQGMKDAVIIFDPQGRILDMNPAAEVVVGLPREEVLGRSDADLYKASKVSGISTDKIAESFKENGYWRGEYSFVRPDGSKAYAEATTYPISNPESGEMGRVSIIRDVTVRKRDEQELHKARNRLSTAQRIAGLGAWELNPATGDLYWSDEMFRIFDLDPKEGKPPGQGRYLEFIHPEDKARLEAAVEQTLEVHAPTTMEYRIITKLGNEKTILGFREPLFDERGNQTGITGTLQDITALRQAERQLQQAQKMEAVGQLTGGIAHDFNNLLMVILGNLELGLELLPANNDLRPILREGLHASQRGAALTRQLLAFSRRQTLMPQPTDINELTKTMLGLARRTLGEVIEIVFEPAEEAWWAHVDPTQLENALLNLAINARDSMPDGGTLAIRTQNLPAGDEAFEAPDALAAGDYVVVEVEDTGTGMSDDIREKAFEPFFTTKEASQGSGLGLSMVYGFVKQSGGHVDIDSSPGKGTTIRLYLPRSLKTSKAARETRTISTKLESSGETVLIVEDDPHVRKLAASLVERLGYTVLQASEAESALDIMENVTGVDLVLSDVILGKGMNGVELANLLREIWPNTKVLLMSGYAPETFMQDSGLGDIFELIGKPFKKSDLAQHIDSLLH